MWKLAPVTTRILQTRGVSISSPLGNSYLLNYIQNNVNNRHFKTNLSNMKDDDINKTNDESSTESNKTSETGTTESVEIDSLKKKVEELMAESSELREKNLHLLAEMENVRNRATQNVEAAKKFGTQSFSKSLLEVADNLERCLSSIPPDSEERKSSLFEGVEAIDKGLLQIFAKNSITQIECKEGVSEFDPKYHIAIFEVDAPEGTNAGIVATVARTGYLLHDRVIRPTQVGVTKKK